MIYVHSKAIKNVMEEKQSKYIKVGLILQQ